MTLEELVVKINGDTGGLEKSFKKIGTIATAAIAAAGTAVAAGLGGIVKGALDGYAEYEQLAGGVETLFKDSADTVKQYAENAYQTAGMSANQYMETVTGFSASLLQSLGGNTGMAAQQANMAITDMADNANKMGSSIESIQNAYQGFAKQNFTMLDNLKLGYGGTREEMQRLLADAEKISGIKYDINNLNDVYNAIHVIQTELGITGTTAEEAASTIEGSSQMMKSSWDNLLTGLADDNADIDVLINNFVESTETYLDNLLPRLEVILQGVGQLLEKIAPIIAEKMPMLIEALSPIFEEGLSLLVEGLVRALPILAVALVEGAFKLGIEFARAIVRAVPMMVEAGKDLVRGLIKGIFSLIEWVYKKIHEFVDMILGWFKKLFGIASPSKKMMENGKFLTQGLANGIKSNSRYVISAMNDMSAEMEDSFHPQIGVAKIGIDTNGLNDAMDLNSYIPAFASGKRKVSITQESTLQTSLIHGNADVINAILAVGSRISKVVEDKDTNIYLDKTKVSRKISREQAIQAKNKGPSLVFV